MYLVLFGTCEAGVRMWKDTVQVHVLKDFGAAWELLGSCLGWGKGCFASLFPPWPTPSRLLPRFRGVLPLPASKREGRTENWKTAETKRRKKEEKKRGENGMKIKLIKWNENGRNLKPRHSPCQRYQRQQRPVAWLPEKNHGRWGTWNCQVGTLKLCSNVLSLSPFVLELIPDLYRTGPFERGPGYSSSCKSLH